MIDDDQSIRQLLHVLLTAEDYDVRTAASGAEGLRSIAVSPPDCVLLDLMMPGMDGYEVLTQIRAQPETRDLTVVMLTAASDDRHAWQAWRGGIDYFLNKPFDLHVLLPYLRTQLHSDPTTRERTTSGATHDA